MIFPFGVSLVSYTELSSPQIGHILAACSVSNIFSPSILLAADLLFLSGPTLFTIAYSRLSTDQKIVTRFFSPLSAGPQGFVIDASRTLITHTAHSCLRSTGQPPASAALQTLRWCIPSYLSPSAGCWSHHAMSLPCGHSPSAKSHSRSRIFCPFSMVYSWAGHPLQNVS